MRVSFPMGGDYLSRARPRSRQQKALAAAAALFLAQAETDTKSDSRLVKHRRAAAACRKLLLESLIELAFLVGTNNYGWTHSVWSRSGLAK